MDNLWPDDIGVTDTIAPVTILKEQASLLGAQTQNIVEATVRNESSNYTEKDLFAYSFYLKSAALGGYLYKLFTIQHGVELYPVTIVPDKDVLQEVIEQKGLGEGTGIICKSEKVFLNALGLMFNSKKTRRVIHSLLAQSGATSKE